MRAGDLPPVTRRTFSYLKFFSLMYCGSRCPHYPSAHPPLSPLAEIRDGKGWMLQWKLCHSSPPFTAPNKWAVSGSLPIPFSKTAGIAQLFQ